MSTCAANFDWWGRCAKRRHGVYKLLLDAGGGDQPLLSRQSAEQFALGCAVPVAQQHGGAGIWPAMQQLQQFPQQLRILAIHPVQQFER